MASVESSISIAFLITPVFCLSLIISFLDINRNHKKLVSSICDALTLEVFLKHTLFVVLVFLIISMSVFSIVSSDVFFLLCIFFYSSGYVFFDLLYIFIINFHHNLFYISFSFSYSSITGSLCSFLVFLPRSFPHFHYCHLGCFFNQSRRTTKIDLIDEIFSFTDMPRHALSLRAQLYFSFHLRTAVWTMHKILACWYFENTYLIETLHMRTNYFP